MKIFFTLISFFFTLSSFAKSDLPSGCGTYVTCEDKKNGAGELDGAQTCYNAGNKKIKVIEAHWKKDLLVDDFWCGNDDGVPKVRAHYKNGELDGNYEEYDASLKEWGLKQTYKNGQREGLSVRKLSNGRKNVTNYQNDQQHGFTIILDADGKVISKSNCQIKNQRRDPKECEQIKMADFSKAIEKHNIATAEKKKSEDNRLVEKKNAAGVVISRHRLVDGQIEGLSENFYKNGKPSLIANYKNGKALDEKEFFEEGQLKRETTFSGHWAEKEKLYYQNGKIESEYVAHVKPEMETLYDYKNYYDNGQLREAYSYITNAFDDWRGGRIEGNYKSYDKNGKIISEGPYKNGLRDGAWVFVSKKQRIEQSFGSGKLLSETLIDLATGKQLRKREFMPDGSVKSDQKSPDYKDD